MNELNRRDVLASLAGAMAMVAATPGHAFAQGAHDNMAVPAPPGSAGDQVLDSPHVFAFDQLPVAKTDNGETRAVIRGVLPTGEAIEMHETRLLAGHMPHPAHKHRHSELILVREGQMQFIDDGQPGAAVGPGGVIFTASNKMHGLKNVGSTTANYFVIAIGREA
jgi:quercetin dioxygenase-like cupin family protein